MAPLPANFVSVSHDVAPEEPWRPPAGGTKLIIREKGGSKGLLKLIEPYLARTSVRERERVTAIMKERLEAQGQSSGT